MKTILTCTALFCLFASTATFAAAAAPAAPPAPAQDGTLPALTSIAGQATLNNHASDYLEELSDYIGGRVTGSPQANEAVKWGMAKMQAIGLSKVRAEKWQISHGWTRGSASASLVDPIQRPLTISSLGWVGSTPKGGVQAQVVAVDSAELIAKRRRTPAIGPARFCSCARKQSFRVRSARRCSANSVPS